MALPIIPTVKPSNLLNMSNGNLPSNLLIDVGAPGTGQLHPLAARAWRALFLLMLGAGVSLTWTWGGLYRSFDSQKSLFLSRYEQCSAATYWMTLSSRRKRWYDAPKYGYSSTYWRKKKINGSYPATAAVPGTSNHGWGLAIDTAVGSHPKNATWILNMGNEKFALFQKEVIACGFSWELQSEPWHIRWVSGDWIPHRVKELEQFLGLGPIESGGDGSTPPPDPTPPTTTDPTEAILNALPTLSLQNRGEHKSNCRTIQSQLNLHGIVTYVDGDYGGQTDRNVRTFQSRNGLTVDGVVGPNTWRKLLYAG